MAKDKLGRAPLSIDGWLILVAIRLIGGVLYGFTSVAQLHQDGYYRSSTSGIEAALILGIIFLVFVIVFFFKRVYFFPKAYIALEAYNSIMSIVIVSSADASFATAFPVLFWAVVWTIYMLVSRRVKRTFVFNWDKTEDSYRVSQANEGLPDEDAESASAQSPGEPQRPSMHLTAPDEKDHTQHPDL